GPRSPAIVRAVHAARSLVFHQRVDDVWMALRDLDADAAESPRRQALGQLLPRIAAVERSVQAAARTAAHESPAAPTPLVPGRERRAPFLIDGAARDAGIVVAPETSLPRFPAVARAIQAALLVRSPEMPHGRDVDDVGVLRVDDDAADVLR